MKKALYNSGKYLFIFEQVSLSRSLDLTKPQVDPLVA